ncbi:hypothetical protein LA080_012815 [Diaporthe eres]|uniref:Uncharacterized protein n=1 Tax=Diaporthe vaccinii TaxID=105482 RepID=A0ABR4EIJ9_9PEZI|nr:hypothetical protein LA080_012815 [Diaporthe eres]
MPGSGSPAASRSGQSDNSSSTINPNTPRLEVDAASSRDDDNSENGGIAQADESSPGKSTASSDRAYDLAPSLPPSKVDMTRLPATMAWQKHHQPGLFLDIHWASVAKKALFKLRFPVSLERFPGLARGGRAFLLLLIYPERIVRLSLEKDAEEPRTVNNARLHATALHFGLARPAVVVMPSQAPCESSNKDSDDMITSLRRVASQTSFTIYFESSNIRQTRDAKWLPQLCVAASRRALTSIVQLASVATLYGGQGGELIEGETFTAPPEYDEVGRATPSINAASTSGASQYPTIQSHHISLMIIQLQAGVRNAGAAKRALTQVHLSNYMGAKKFKKF